MYIIANKYGKRENSLGSYDHYRDAYNVLRKARRSCPSAGYEILEATYIEESIEKALRKINGWLKPSGLSVTVSDETLSDGCVGEYEADSVFSKVIEVRIDTKTMRQTLDEDHDLYGKDSNEIEFLNQIALTIFHEAGHGILEQINDWTENIEEIRLLADGEFGKRFEEVFDDALPEEDLVEEFADSFFLDTPSPLSLCFEELNKYIIENL